RGFVNLRAAVVDAIADHRPAIVLALLDDVDLVAALRAVLLLPQFSAHRMEREALRIAMSVAPDFAARARASDERIVRRDRAVGGDAHDLAVVDAKILRRVARAEMIAERDEEIAVLALRDAAAMIVRAARAVLAEDHLDVAERRVTRERCARDRG